MTVFEEIVDLVVSHSSLSEEDEHRLEMMEPVPESIAELRRLVNNTDDSEYESYSPFVIKDAFTDTSYGNFESFKDFINADLAVDKRFLLRTVKDLAFPRNSSGGVILSVSHADLDTSLADVKLNSECCTLNEILDNITKYLNTAYKDVLDEDISDEARELYKQIYDTTKHDFMSVGFDVTLDVLTGRHMVKPAKKRNATSETHVFSK